MVSAGSLAVPFMVVVALWFVSTGLVAMINHRLHQSYGRALIVAGGCAALGLLLLVMTAHSAAVWATYVSFVGGLLVWSWHEINFLSGAVAGPHRRACPPGARGWQRFSLATMALIHHEIALAMTAALLLSLATVTANGTGAYAFALLLIFRLSSKLNIYRGVPNMSDELLPSHLAYLKSYFGPRRLHPMLIVSTLAILGLASWFALAAIRADDPARLVEAALLGCLSLLAALEHLFLAIPFRDSALWGWAINSNEKEQNLRGG